jgi:hypothetical protein
VKTSVIISPGTSDKVNDLQAQCCWKAVKLGCWQKGKRTDYSPLRGRFSARYMALVKFWTRHWVQEHKLRYAEHVIRSAEDLLQRALFRAMPEGRRNQERLKSSWVDSVNSDSKAFGARDWTNFARDRVQWKDLLRRTLTKSWL